MLFTLAVLTFAWIVIDPPNPSGWTWWWEPSLRDAWLILAVSLGFLVIIGVLESSLVGRFFKWILGFLPGA